MGTNFDPHPAPELTGNPWADLAINTVPLTRIAGGFYRTGKAIGQGDMHGAGRAAVAPGVEAVATVAGAALGGGAGAAEGAAAEGAGTGASRFIYHGTTQGGAESIMSPAGVQAVSTNTAQFPTGSFFTFEGGDAARVAASHWSVRSAALHGGPRAVLQGEIPVEVMRSLEAGGLVRTGSVPGLPFFPPQTVFLPEALPILNQNVVWAIVSPVF